MKIACITGASSGIGAATATVFAQNGYNLILIARRSEKLNALATELAQQFGVQIHQAVVDVRNAEAVATVVKELPDYWKKIDILVNNAGLASGLSTIDKGDIADWDVMIDTNLKGLLYMTRAITPLMVERKSGHIINIGSIAGKEVYANGNVYCATKHAVDALNKAMRIDLAPHEIKVTAIHPGAVETEFSIVRFHGDTERAQKVYEGFDNLVAQDIAEAIWFAVSRPTHVNINELTIMPTAQPVASVIHRKL
ncbi:MAG: SDR family NAD(P)-dependent oxidoreductase [Bacteroidia bacterium]|jgi:NADP-dependent 3-hydroxy acid dehydrogenase YdfG|nr:SDR family NAD(P)-dependent oxidoreductase [Bacteroidia bacterium]